MPSWLISFLFAVGVTGFVYTKLVRATGHSSLRQDLGGACIAGVLTFIFIWTLLKFVFNFK
jgi:hypothetical protein